MSNVSSNLIAHKTNHNV